MFFTNNLNLINRIVSPESNANIRHRSTLKVEKKVPDKRFVYLTNFSLRGKDESQKPGQIIKIVEGAI